MIRSVIIDAALAARCTSIEEVKNLTLGGRSVAERITELSGVTGEKMELDGYFTVTGESIAAYNHQNNNVLCTLVAFNKPIEDATVGKNVAMQVASAAPIAVNADAVPQETKDNEFAVAVEKTKVEQVQKAVEAAIKKAGFNAYIAESEEHINEGIMKGNITEADAEKIREIKKTVAEEKAANLPEQMIQNIANGRLNKFYKESCLVEQAYIMNEKQSVKEFMKTQDAELKILAFKRVNLNQD